MSISHVKRDLIERKFMSFRSNDEKENNEINGYLRFVVALGAESGFSEKEEQIFVKNGFQSISLGNRILRTETATIVALSLVQFLFGDLD